MRINFVIIFSKQQVVTSIFCPAVLVELYSDLGTLARKKSRNALEITINKAKKCVCFGNTNSFAPETCLHVIN